MEAGSGYEKRSPSATAGTPRRPTEVSGADAAAKRRALASVEFTVTVESGAR